MTKSIPLTQGKFALVDDEDFEYLNQWKWCCNHDGYACRGYQLPNKKIKIILMHRLIMCVSSNSKPLVDHINGEKLDNRRNNLRLCNQSENLRNSKKRKNNKSGFKGVTYSKQRKKWRAQIFIGKKVKHLGMFKDKILAALAYDEAATLYFGEFAKTNFL